MSIITSQTLDSNGALRFSNRPVTLRFYQNGEIPTNISRNLAFSAADVYYLDLLSY